MQTASHPVPSFVEACDDYATMNDSEKSPPAALARPRVLSGMRPTGKLHLGNYMGALYNWVKLQHQYDCFFFIADWHALTTGYMNTSELRQHIMDVAIDFLAAGLDPEVCTISNGSPPTKTSRSSCARRTWPLSAFSATRCCRPPIS
jgi:hypothetical protein